MSECCATESARPLCERLAEELPDIKCPCGRSDGTGKPGDGGAA